MEHVEEELLVREVLLRRNADVVHGNERVERVLSHGALRVEQEPISSIDDRSMDIRDFSPQGERVEDHGVEELRGEDHGLRLVVAELDDVLLDPADLLNRQDGTQLTSRHQNCVTTVENLVDVVDGVFVLQLGHQAHVRIDAELAQLVGLLLHHFLQLDELVVTIIDRVDHIVDIILQDEAKILS